jgi:hypothetical protein
MVHQVSTLTRRASGTHSSGDSVMACEEKARLVGEYEAATKRFAASVTDLQRKIGTSLKAEYDRRVRVSDEARVKSEQSRLALKQHVAAHRC